jgi:hypothetical protein
MPQTQTLAPEIRESIAEQIGLRAPASFVLAARGAAAELGESLKVMMLPEEAVRSGSGGLAGRVVDTDQWHHQVYRGGQAASFARSVALTGPEGPRPDAPHDVVEVARSPLPAALNRTIEWVDANVPEDAVADLLVSPAFALTGLWIHGDGTDAVVVSSVGQTIRDIPLNTRLEAEDFLSRLAGNEAIAGLGPTPPSS